MSLLISCKSLGKALIFKEQQAEVVAARRGGLLVEEVKLLHRKAQLLETLLGRLVPVCMGDLAGKTMVTLSAPAPPPPLGGGAYILDAPLKMPTLRTCCLEPYQSLCCSEEWDVEAETSLSPATARWPWRSD